jgi:hypothetical protein
VGSAAALAALNRMRFGRRVAHEARLLWSVAGEDGWGHRAPDPPAPHTLPEPVRRYAEHTLAARAAPVRYVRLRHGGSFRTALGGPWLPARGLEYFAAEPPGFVWWGRVRLAPGVWFDARDCSVGGSGSMHVKVASTFTIIDSEGPEIDQGALVRLLGEMVWFPSALFDPRFVTWHAVDERSARATLRVDGQEASCTFGFDGDGLPVTVSTERFRDAEGGAVLTPWSVENEDFRDVAGFLVPHRSVVRWHIDGRPVPYADFNIELIEYDVPEPFGG